jgi:hypothetical protein
MNFSNFFKSSNRYGSVLLVSFVVLSIIALLTLMGGSGNSSSNNFPLVSIHSPSKSENIEMNISLPKNDTTSFLDTSDPRTLEEEVISTMSPVVTNENLGNPSYLPVIDSNLNSTDLNELN